MGEVRRVWIKRVEKFLQMQESHEGRALGIAHVPQKIDYLTQLDRQQIRPEMQGKVPLVLSDAGDR
jgi:hypothetical protein